MIIDTREIAVYNLWDSLLRLCALGHTAKTMEFLREAHAAALNEPDDPENRIARVLEIAMDF